MMDLAWAKKRLSLLDSNEKFETMLYTSAIITKLLDPEDIKPIIVGGLSVEIYTQKDYSTRDIDFVTHRANVVSELLVKLGFQREGRHLYHENLEVAIEFPDDSLAGSYDKVVRMDLDEEEDLYVYVISVEDIIMDRLRASLYWGESESKQWAMKLIASYYQQLDLSYMQTVGQGAENNQEMKELQLWIDQLIKLKILPENQ